jgi:hypothetical protein
MQKWVIDYFTKANVYCVPYETLTPWAKIESVAKLAGATLEDWEQLAEPNYKTSRVFNAATLPGAEGIEARLLPLLKVGGVTPIFEKYRT